MAEKSFGVKEVNLIGASGTPSITSPNNINLNAVNVAISTNVSIGGTLTVSGSLSIGGTITYEDVTNVDSVGIITARTSIKLDTDGSASSNFLSIGADDDLKIFHQSNVDKIESSGGGLHIRQINNGDLHIHAGANTGSANNRLVARAGGKAELYYGGALKLSTETGGVNITGVCTATSFVGDGSNITALNGSQISSGTVPVARIGTGTKNTSTFYRGDGTFATVTAPAITAINSASNNRIVTSDGGTTVTAESGFTFDGSSVVIEAGNSAIKTKSTSNGNQTVVMSSGTARADQISITNSSIAGLFWHNGDNYSIHKTAGAWSGNYQQLTLEWITGIHLNGGTSYGLSGVRFSSHALPTANNTYDLGTSSLRWRNVYTNDLNLSNEGSSNDVDGTWGNYTIQEGESDLFLINKRSGKKYKFNLTEVS